MMTDGFISHDIIRYEYDQLDSQTYHVS